MTDPNLVILGGTLISIALVGVAGGARGLYLERKHAASKLYLKRAVLYAKLSAAAELEHSVEIESQKAAVRVSKRRSRSKTAVTAREAGKLALTPAAPSLEGVTGHDYTTLEGN